MRTVKTTDMLIFSWGEIVCPPDMIPQARRKDGDPDMRFRSSKLWWERFNKMEKDGLGSNEE